MFSPIRKAAEALTAQKVAIGTTLILASVGGIYTLRIRSRIAQIDQKHIRSSLDASDAFKNSRTVRNLVNPRSHVTIEDSHSTILTICSKQKVPSEEELLSAFVRGFFSGPVFSLERTGLRLLPFWTVHFDELIQSVPEESVWSTSQLSNAHLPLKSTILWGTFQVANIELSAYNTDESAGSRVDIVFGDGQGSFAGCHRFSVKQLESSPHSEEGKTDFNVSLECIVCNPTTNKPIRMQWQR